MKHITFRKTHTPFALLWSVVVKYRLIISEFFIQGYSAFIATILQLPQMPRKQSRRRLIMDHTDQQEFSRYCGLVTPYGDNGLGQYWPRKWLAVWRHQVIAWINVDILRSSDTHPIWQDIPQLLTTDHIHLDKCVYIVKSTYVFRHPC